MPIIKPKRTERHTTYSARIVFYDTPQTKKRLEAEAKRTGKNFSDFMRERERQLKRLGVMNLLRNH